MSLNSDSNIYNQGIEIQNMKAFNMIENLSVVFLEDENNHKTLKGLPWYWGNFYLMTFYAV